MASHSMYLLLMVNTRIKLLLKISSMRPTNSGSPLLEVLKIVSYLGKIPNNRALMMLRLLLLLNLLLLRVTPLMTRRLTDGNMLTNLKSKKNYYEISDDVY